MLFRNVFFYLCVFNAFGLMAADVTSVWTQERIAMVQSLPQVITLESLEATVFKPSAGEDGRFTPPSLVDCSMRSFLRECDKLERTHQDAKGWALLQGLMQLPPGMRAFEKYEVPLCRVLGLFQFDEKKVYNFRHVTPALSGLPVMKSMWHNKSPDYFGCREWWRQAEDSYSSDEEPEVIQQKRERRASRPKDGLGTVLKEFSRENKRTGVRYYEETYAGQPIEYLCSMSKNQQTAHVAYLFDCEAIETHELSNQNYLEDAIDTENGHVVKLLLVRGWPTERYKSVKSFFVMSLYDRMRCRKQQGKHDLHARRVIADNMPAFYKGYVEYCSQGDEADAHFAYYPELQPERE